MPVYYIDTSALLENIPPKLLFRCGWCVQLPNRHKTTTKRTFCERFIRREKMPLARAERIKKLRYENICITSHFENEFCRIHVGYVFFMH